MAVSNNYSEFSFNDSLIFEDENDYFVEIVTLFIEIIGIIGNALVIFIILYYKKMHNVPNYLILSVAIGDLLFMLFSAPFTIISLGFPSAAGNEFVCKLTNFILILSQGVSALSFTALSADRYFAINMAVAPMRDYAKRVTYFSIIVSWTTSLSFALPVIWFSTVYYVLWTDKFVCTFAPQNAWKHAMVVYQTCRFLFLYALPVIVISVLYTLVAMELFRSIREMPTESTRSTSKSASASKNQAQARKRLAITVLVLAVMYTFCWLPYMFKEIYVEIGGENIPFNSHYKDVSFIMLYLSSCINPFALVAMSRNYRKYFLRLLLCGKVQGRRKKPHPNTITSYSYNSVMSKPLHCNNEIETVIEEPEV